MLLILFRIKSFIAYWLLAVDKHSLHSPFFFDFYCHVIRQKNNKAIATPIEGLRQKLIADTQTLTMKDLGAGSVHEHNKTVRVSTIAKTSLTPHRFSSLYARIVQYYKAKNVIELGTSLGINTLYLAANMNTKVTTFEGSPEVASIASLLFEFMHTDNISMIEGNIDHTLPSFLQQCPKLDVVFMDANHRYEPTLKYFELILKKIHSRSVIIMDDIHYSPEMQMAWKTICAHALVYGSVDLYRCGLLFFDPSLNKQHVVMQF